MKKQMELYVKYAEKRFKSKRLRKKQVSVLKKAYKKLSKRHHICCVHITCSSPVSEKEEYLAYLSMAFGVIDIQKGNEKYYKPECSELLNGL